MDEMDPRCGFEKIGIVLTSFPWKTYLFARFFRGSLPVPAIVARKNEKKKCNEKRQSISVVSGFSFKLT